MKRRVRWAIVIICSIGIAIRLMFPDVFASLYGLQLDPALMLLVAIAGLALIEPHVGPLIKHLGRVHKRWVIVVVCLALVVLETALPGVQVDISTIWLIGIAAALFILPDLKSLAPYVKRIRFGDTELELRESISSLEGEVEKAQDAVAEQAEGTPTAAASVSSDVDKVLEESGKDPRAALLLLSSKIEEQLRSRLAEADIDVSRPYSLIRYVELGVHHGVFPQEFLPAFRDFWSVRNKVAHGAAFRVEDSYILSLISLGTQLLRMTSTSMKREGQEEEPK